MPRNTDQYFATLPPGLEYLEELRNKINAYRNFCDSSGLGARWSISVGAYFGVSEDGKTSWRVTPGGEMGELVQQKVNDYARLLKHQLILAVQQRPAGIARAINSDQNTLQDARVASLLVEYYLSDPSHMFEADYVRALEYALCSAEGFIVQDWDATLGTLIRPDENGGEMKEGDLTQMVCSTWNAARDIGAPNAEQPWYIFSYRVNKFDLAAKFPAFTDEIVLENQQNGGAIRPAVLFPIQTEESDFIEVHKLIHLPTPACPEGRYTIFVPETILLDVPYPYPSKCFHRASAGELFETPFGHTSNYDLLSLEQVTDSLHSVILNNQTTFGVSTIVGPKGAGLAHQELAKGLRYLELDPNLVDKVRPLNLTATPVEVFNYLMALGTKKGEISGINSILSGDPQGMLKGASGSAMALLQSQAIQFNSNFQKAFYRLLQSGGTGIIEILRRYATEPRIVKIAGKSNAEAVREYKFDSKTLQSISTVVFEPVNPVLQTAAGKLSVADSLLEKNMISSPKRYIEVLTTGNLNVLLEDDVSKQEAILEENERLAEGRPVRAIITENHQEHIMGHSGTIQKLKMSYLNALEEAGEGSPQVMEANQRLMNAMNHDQEHITLWQQASMTNPALLAATNQIVLPGMAPMPAPGVGPGGAPAGPPAPNSGAEGPQQPSLPKPPKNPATGERVQLEPGTSIS